MLHFALGNWLACAAKSSILEKERHIITGRRILGIDPGTATVGYGALFWRQPERFEYLGSGIIKTLPNMGVGKRLSIIRSDLLSLLDEYKPDVLAVEALFFCKNVRTGMSVAQARGVILEAAECKSVPVKEYTPMQVKLHLTGFGRSDKRVVQDMIARLLELPAIIRPDDASDALALAVCHARMSVADSVNPSRSA